LMMVNTYPRKWVLGSLVQPSTPPSVP